MSLAWGTEVHMCGYLKKTNSGNSRYFVLRTSRKDPGTDERPHKAELLLEWFDTRNQWLDPKETPRESLALDACELLVQRLDSHNLLELVLATPERVLTVRVSTVVEFQAWMWTLGPFVKGSDPINGEQMLDVWPVNVERTPLRMKRSEPLLSLAKYRMYLSQHEVHFVRMGTPLGNLWQGAISLHLTTVESFKTRGSCLVMKMGKTSKGGKNSLRVKMESSAVADDLLKTLLNTTLTMQGEMEAAAALKYSLEEFGCRTSIHPVMTSITKTSDHPDGVTRAVMAPEVQKPLDVRSTANDETSVHVESTDTQKARGKSSDSRGASSNSGYVFMRPVMPPEARSQNVGGSRRNLCCGFCSDEKWFRDYGFMLDTTSDESDIELDDEGFVVMMSFGATAM